MNPVRSLARRPSRARSIGRSQGPSFSSDNPLPAFLAFLAEDTKVGERTARPYVAHLQRFAAWLEQGYQAALLEATTRDLPVQNRARQASEAGFGQCRPGRTAPFVQMGGRYRAYRPQPCSASDR